MEEGTYKIRKQRDTSGTLMLFKVQMCYVWMWVTIKQFSAPINDEGELWWAEAQALNLLDELNKEL